MLSTCLDACNKSRRKTGQWSKTLVVLHGARHGARANDSSVLRPDTTVQIDFFCLLTLTTFFVIPADILLLLLHTKKLFQVSTAACCHGNKTKGRQTLSKSLKCVSNAVQIQLV